jgi:hypothetical protein
LFDEPVPSAADVSSPAARNRAGEVVLFGED